MNYMTAAIESVSEDDTLDAATWFDQMGRLLQGLIDSDATPERNIRKAYHLLCLAPHALKRMLPTPVAETRLEKMLECGAYESAVALLLGATGHVTVVGSDGGRGIEVRMRIDPQAPEEPHEPWAMAMLEAWAVSFLRFRALPN